MKEKELKISSRAKRLIGQGMFQIKAKAEELERNGEKLLHFEIGDSYFDAPKSVKKACIKAIKQNKTHYTDPKGLYELRKEVAKKTNRKIENVAIVPANFGIFALLSVLCNKGDKIKYPVPGFPTYKAVADYLGLKHSNEAKIEIVNCPNNPTGELDNSCLNNFIIFDAAYASMVYGLVNKIQLCSAIIGSFSKSHAMSGFRLGYVIAPKKIIDKIGLLVETTYSCLPEFVQWAGLEALKIQGYKMDELEKRRDLMYEILSEHYPLEKPEGGIYCWCYCNDGNKEFEELLKKGIVACPGSVFGKKDYIRFCFARPIKDIKKLGELLCE